MSSNRRDTFILAAVAVIVVVGFFILKEPAAEPEAAEHQHGSVPGMDQAMASSSPNFPTDYNSLVGMGNQTMDQQNFAVAAEAYRRALAIDGSDPHVRTDYGACLHGMGLADRALQEFQMVIADNPRHAIAHFNVGIVYYNMGQTDSARVYWNRVLEFEPEGNVATTARQYLQQISP